MFSDIFTYLSDVNINVTIFQPNRGFIVVPIMNINVPFCHKESAIYWAIFSLVKHIVQVPLVTLGL